MLFREKGIAIPDCVYKGNTFPPRKAINTMSIFILRASLKRLFL